MGDRRHHDAPQLGSKEYDVTEEWRERALAALADNETKNRSAGLRPRDPNRLPDDHASLARAIGLDDYSGIRTLLGARKSESKRPSKIVAKSKLVKPISDALGIGLPTSDDEFLAKMMTLSPALKALLATYHDDPDLERILAEHHLKHAVRRK